MREELNTVLEHIHLLSNQDKQDIIQQIKEHYCGLSPRYLLANAFELIQMGNCQDCPTGKITKQDFKLYLVFNVVGGNEPKKDFYEHLEDQLTTFKLIQLAAYNWGDFKSTIHSAPEDLVQQAILKFYSGKRKKYPKLKISEQNYLYFMGNKPTKVNGVLQGFSIISKIVSDILASLRAKEQIYYSDKEGYSTKTISDIENGVEETITAKHDWLEKSGYEEYPAIQLAASKYDEDKFLEYLGLVKKIMNIVKNTPYEKQPFFTEVFVQYYLNFTPQEEIAEKLGCSTAKISNTTQKLKIIFDQVNTE